MSNKMPTIINPDLFARPTFQRHFQKAHAENVARHLPRPTPEPEPAPRLGRKTHDTRQDYVPTLVLRRNVHLKFLE